MNPTHLFLTKKKEIHFLQLYIVPLQCLKTKLDLGPTQGRTNNGEGKLPGHPGTRYQGLQLNADSPRDTGPRDEKVWDIEHLEAHTRLLILKHLAVLGKVEQIALPF